MHTYRIYDVLVIHVVSDHQNNYDEHVRVLNDQQNNERHSFAPKVAVPTALGKDKSQGLDEIKLQEVQEVGSEEEENRGRRRSP